MNIIRGAIYIVLAFILVSLIYTGFDYFIEYVLKALGYLQIKLGNLLFWLFFFVIGALFLSMIWVLFKYVAMIIVALIARISPNKGFAKYSMLIISYLNAVLFTIKTWRTTEGASLVVIITLIVISISALSLAQVLTSCTYTVIKSYDKDKLIEDVLKLKEIEAGEFELEHLEIIRRLYKQPDMPVKRALELFVEIKAKADEKSAYAELYKQQNKID